MSNLSEGQKYEHLWYLIDAWRTAPTPEEMAVAVGEIESHLERLEISYKEHLLGGIKKRATKIDTRDGRIFYGIYEDVLQSLSEI